MKRKEFLKNLMALSIGAPFLSTLATSCNKNAIDFYDDIKERLIYEDCDDNDHAYDVDTEESFEDFTR